MPTRLQEKYVNVIRPSLVKEFSYKNALEAPRLDKIVINMGVGEAVGDGKRIQSAVQDLTSIAGQKPVITKARKAIANFKLREGMNIGCKVTLRRERMYELLDRLVNIALPRVRDFPASRARASTAMAIMPSASRSSSSSRRSTTTRSMPCVAWISSSARRRRVTPKPKPC